MSEQQYTTPGGNTVEDFTNFHTSAKSGNPSTLLVTLRSAARTVSGIVTHPPVPEPNGDLPTDYAEGLHDAELLVARWIWDTKGGQVSSKGQIQGSSVSYSSNKNVIDLVTGQLGAYVETPQESSGDDGVIRVGRLRI